LEFTKRERSMKVDDLIILRKDVDDIDEQILQLIKHRVALMKKIGEVKKSNNTTISDKERENEIMKAIYILAEKHDIPKNLVEKIWEAFFDEAKEIEK